MKTKTFGSISPVLQPNNFEYLLLLPELITAHLDRLQPQLQLLRALWSGLSAREFLHQVDYIDVGQALLGHSNGPHKVISHRDELLLEVDGLIIPPDQLQGEKEARFG